MLRYVAMELAEGRLPDGTTYIPKEPLLARRAPQVAIGKDEIYGMGLMVDTRYGVPVVHHGGDMVGFHSDMIWLPESNVGAVILTNGNPGWTLRSQLRRKLLEVLFDGHPEADAQVAAQPTPSMPSSPPSASCSLSPPTPRRASSSPHATRTRRAARSR